MSCAFCPEGELFFFIYRAGCLQAKPSWCHMATGVIIWMLWCTSTAKSVLWASMLRVGDTWNTLHEYEFLTVLCIYKQLDLVPENSPVIAVPITLGVWTGGNQCERKGSDMNKSTSVCVSLIHTLCTKPPLACCSFILVISAQAEHVTPTNHIDARVNLCPVRLYV